MQTRLEGLILGAQQTLSSAKALVDAAKIWGRPILVTEQYPKAFQHTCKGLEVEYNDEKAVVLCEKTDFSMVTDRTRNLVLAELKHNRGVTGVVLVGWEAHVCVQQTCLDLLELGLNVFVCEDGVSSQRARDRRVALGTMQQAGAVVSTCESILFELMRSKEHEHFKAIQPLVVAHAKKVSELVAQQNAATKARFSPGGRGGAGGNKARLGENGDAGGVEQKLELKANGSSGGKPQSGTTNGEVAAAEFGSSRLVLPDEF
eukprot:g13708.t1